MKNHASQLLKDKLCPGSKIWVENKNQAILRSQTVHLHGQINAFFEQLKLPKYDWSQTKMPRIFLKNVRGHIRRSIANDAEKLLI